MQRTPVPQNRPPAVATPEDSPSKLASRSHAVHDHVGTFWDMLAIRIVFTADLRRGGISLPSVQHVARSRARRRAFSLRWR